jgi:Zn-dependent metalloprotease
MIGLQKYMGWEKVVGMEHEVFYRESDGVRISVDEATGEETIVRKERVKNEDFKKLKGTPYDVRFSVSKEHPMPPDTNRDMDKKKTKKRMSFIRKNLSIDMTICRGDSHDMDAEDPMSYQIEFEIIDPTMCQYEG